MKKWPARQAAWFINGQKDEGRRAHEVTSGDDLFQITHKRIYQAYEEVCHQGGLVDFAELLLRSHELWLNDSQLLGHYQQRFAHLLVDEFQDTNTIQYAWLRVLAGQTSKVMAVGDDDQSIYGWRGAKIENIHQFTSDFADVATVRLEQNYRSTQTILEAANGLIQRNTNRLGKELWSDGDKGELLKVYAGFNDLDEARFIAERIQQWVEDGGSPNESAILYRSNAQSRVLEEALLRLNIPYQIYGGQRFSSELKLKTPSPICAYRESAPDPAFERVVNTPTRALAIKRWKVFASSQELIKPHYGKPQKTDFRGAFTARVSGAVGTFILLIDQLADAVAPLHLDELAEYVIDASGLMNSMARSAVSAGWREKKTFRNWCLPADSLAVTWSFPLKTATGQKSACCWSFWIK